MEHQIMELVILAKDCNINLALQAWLDRWHITPHVKIDKHNIPSARNAAVDEFLAANGKATHLIFMDNGIWPDPSTDAILRASGHTIYLGYASTDGNVAHIGDGKIGCSCARFSREALQAIDAPWFEFQTDEKGIEVTACECTNISNKLADKGFTPRMVGVVHHAVEMLAEPTDKGIRLITKADFLRRLSKAET